MSNKQLPLRFYAAPLWCTLLSLLLQVPATQAARPEIVAILGGGTVLGTECVNGKVVHSLYQSSARFTEFGPEATLYVQSPGPKTRLERSAGTAWNDTPDYRYNDKVNFKVVGGINISNLQHYLVKGTGQTTQASFGAADGGGASVPAGQGEYMMRFVPYGDAPSVDLGLMYTATANGGYPVTWSCAGPDPTPEDQTPDAPTITDLVPGNQLLTATYSTSPETTHPIVSYQYKLEVVDGAAGNWKAISGALPTAEQNATLKLTGLTNDTTYAVTIRAIDSQGGEGDPSNPVTDTPRAPITLEANAGNNFLGWKFTARPETTVAGEAPVTGRQDHDGGSASLNFTLSGVMGNSRGVRLQQTDFAAAGISGVTKLKHLSSISWRIHHSDPLSYPRFIVTLRAKPLGEFEGSPFYYEKYENLNFVPGNQKLNPNRWDTVTVDFTDMGSKFRHSGPLEESDTIAINAGTNQKYTINQWIDQYGELDIERIQWAYGSKDNALTFTSHIDYLEINGTTFDFEGAPLQPPGPPTDVVATPGDGQVSVAFAAAVANSEPVTRCEYQLGTQDVVGNWSEGNWTSTGGTSSPFTINSLTNGTDYRVGLRAVSNAGEGEESPVVIFAPRKATSAIGLTVQAGSPRGFSLAGFTSDYVKDRSAVGIADGEGGNASINASLTGQGGDRWGMFLKPAQYKADVKAEEGGDYGGRKVDRLSDLTSLSFRVNHSGNGSYPRLGFQMARATDSDDGKTIAQLNVDMSQMPPLDAGWNLVSIDFGKTLFKSSYLSEGELSEKKTLSEWIAEYGDRRINLIRWQTGSGGGETTNTTYVDQIEVNGVTYNFEGLLPLPPAAPTDLVAQPGTEAGITFTFTPGDPGDSAITRYEYSLNGDAGSAAWTSLGNIASPYQFVVSSGLKNGREDTLFLRAVSNSGVGESATVAFRPRADFADITLTVDSTDARGFYLSSASSAYVKERDQAGIPDKNGGTTKSLNASLSNSGDVWRAEIKAEDLNAGGRFLGKLHDIESLSYGVWHDAKGNYPQLSILIDRLDGERAEALYLQTNNQPLATTNAWNTVTVNRETSLFKNNNQNNSSDDNAGATYTLNQWIALYGDRVVKRMRWGGTRNVPSTTYLDFLEINGATYDFEAVPPAVITPPPTIQSVTAGDGQVTVSFSAGDNADATVLAYEYKVDKGEWTSTPDGDTVAPFTVSGLTNGTPYTLAMHTVSASLGDNTLESEASDSVSFIPVGLPLPPKNLSATVGDGSAEINFTNSGTGNGAAIINYHVSVDGNAFNVLSTPDDSGPITITGLTNGQSHSVALKTQTSVGLSVASASLTFTPVSGASAPDAPTNVVLTPGDKQLAVSFMPGSDNGAAISNYAYQINGGTWIDLSPASTASSLVITGLSNGETYSMSFRGINAKGRGANSAPVTATLPRPKLIIFTDDGKTIDLNITPESGSSCSIATAALAPAPALEANVKLAYVNMLNFTLENCNAGETVAVAITLSEDPPTDGIAYKYQGGQWRVIAGATISGKTISYDLTDNGPLDADSTSGKISDPVAVAVPTGVPDAPTDLTATAGNGSAVIAFTAGDNGGEPITNYEYSVDGATFVALDPAVAVSPITVTGLTNGKVYSLALKAVNENGAGPPSEEVLFTPYNTPVPLPVWLFALLSALIGGLGYRRLGIA